MRHRFTIRDLGILAAVLCVAAYIAFEVDIFMHEGDLTEKQAVVELDESLMLGGLLAVGLLIFATRRYLDQKREMARRIAAERQARELAYQDPLTGLANRRQFTEALRVQAGSPPPAGFSHGVLMLDLNGFKGINDTYGHGIGDDVLVVVAQRLQQAVREGDLVARLGGDEFVVLAPHLMGPEAAISIAQRIIGHLAEPIVAGGVSNTVGTGIGLALMPGDGIEPAEILRKADVALYRAKAERRSAYRFFEEDMDRLVREREAMERALNEALVRGDIKPRFQPALDLRSGAVIGFDAIPSWQDGDTDIPPERFLPIAEETGLVHQLAETVLRRACEAASTWPSDVSLSIDILPGQLKNRDLAAAILETVRQSGFAPARLEVDIAESVVVQDVEAAKQAIMPLRQAGVSVALDQFGTGYSNLYHMQEFHIDKVKIDRRFTENLGEEGSARMVRALAGLGQGLGLTVSADGFTGLGSAVPLLSCGVQQAQSVGGTLTESEARLLLEAQAA